MAMSTVSKSRSIPGPAMAREWPSTSGRTTNNESSARAATAHPRSYGSQTAGVNSNFRRLGRTLAWVALVSIAIVIALALQDLATSALVAPETTELTAPCRTALAAGDNVRETFLEHSCAGAFGTTPKP
jgi:hypothetical protein